MKAYISEDYYYHYRYEVTPVGEVGEIVKLYRLRKENSIHSNIEYVGSYFTQKKEIKPQERVNYGINARYEGLRSNSRQSVRSQPIR